MTTDFERLFQEISEKPRPYPWQRRLFEAFVSGRCPDAVNVPTGAGKTSVMYVWLLARAAGACVPRRLVWVVDRRVVVDQATDEAEGIAERIQTVPEVLDKTGRLAVSTLRGERADNGEWSEDPSRMAIIVGTVDMVGSRLLFSGYGDGKWKRPQHAGLLGTDTLIVNDESHLTPAFARLLEEVRAQRPPEANFRTLLLSATPSEGGERWPASLEEDLRENAEFELRYRARKDLRLVECKARVEDEIVKQALADGEEYGPRRLVFVQSPEKAADIARSIEKKAGSDRVLLLTGTMRGFERDRLTKDPVFAEFKQKTGGEKCWMVATSAGEVGVDITSDVLITELDTADHLVQRFGRLNRFGGDKGLAIVVYRPPSDKDPEKKACLEYLRELTDVTGETMFERPAPKAAKPPLPAIARFDGRLVDLWSMTSADTKAKPAVEPWLHGRQEEYPQTEVAWREDVAWLTRRGIASDEVREVLRRHRVLAHEKLTEPTGRLFKKIKALPGETRAIVVRADGEPKARDLGNLDEEELEYALLLFPAGVGTLVKGMLAADGDGKPADDVADESGERKRARFLVKDEAVRRLGAEDESGAEAKGWRLPIPVEQGESDQPDCQLYYWTERERRSESDRRVLLPDHLGEVAEAARELALRLELDETLVAAFVKAGELHDLGKDRDLWQRAAGRRDGELALAKPVQPMRPAALGGYRHELGSLLDAGELPEEIRDLTLHLIASHHGWARPHFPARAMDKSAVRRSEEELVETTRRFGRLQARYGAWGLAYLEAIFRAADAEVSKREASAEEQPEHA